MHGPVLEEKKEGHVLQVDKLRVSLREVDRSVRAQADARSQMMIDNRRRNVEAFVAREAGAETQVAVLVYDEEILVEPPQLLEHRASIDRSSRACAKNLSRLAITLLRLKVTDLPRYAFDGIEVAAGIRQRAVIVEEHLRGADADLGMAVISLQDLLDPMRICLGVVIYQGNVLATRIADPRIVARAEAGILLKDDEPHLREPPPYQVNRAVG